jgi:hypothetical protein
LNVSPLRRFVFRLAGHLGMTVRELSERMDSRELSEWMAFTRYYEALPDSWAETGLMVSAMLAPYSPKGKAPKASDFIPLEKPPQHDAQAADVVRELARQLGILGQ